MCTHYKASAVAQILYYSSCCLTLPPPPPPPPPNYLVLLSDQREPSTAPHHGSRDKDQGGRSGQDKKLSQKVCFVLTRLVPGFLYEI
jgi:hypothetical protein